MFLARMKVCTLLATCMAAALAMTNADDFFKGKGTCYTLGQSSAGNCNMMSALDFATTDYAALNDPQWDGLQNCGRCASVSCDDDRCPDQNKSIVVQILDRCPECKIGDLDLSPSVFEKLTGSDPSIYKIKWNFVDCPVSGNINYCLKVGSNNFWTAVQPTNVATGVKNLQINGKDTIMLSSAYYYMLDGVGQTQTDLSSMTISMTDVNGNSIEETVSLKADSCTEGTNQFPSGGSTQPYQQMPTTISQPPTQVSAPLLTPIIHASPPPIHATPSTYQQPMQQPPPTYQQPPSTIQQPIQQPLPTMQQPLPTTQQPPPTIQESPPTMSAYSPTQGPSATTAPGPSQAEQQEILPITLPVSATVTLPTTPLSTTVTPITASPPASPPKAVSPIIAPALPTEQKSAYGTNDDDTSQTVQQSLYVSGTVGLESTESSRKTFNSQTSTSMYINTNLGLVQQQTQQTASLPAATTTTPSKSSEQTAELSHAASDTAEWVNTKSGDKGSGPDWTAIVMSSLCAVGVVALVVVIVVVKRKNIEEQKVRDVDMPSMITAQSFDAHSTPSDRQRGYDIL